MTQLAFKLKEGQKQPPSLGGNSQFEFDAERGVIHGSFEPGDIAFLSKRGYERVKYDAAPVAPKYPDVLEMLNKMGPKKVRDYIAQLAPDLQVPADEKVEALRARAYALYAAAQDAAADDQGGAGAGEGSGAEDDPSKRASEDGSDAGGGSGQPGNQTQGGGSTFSQQSLVGGGAQ